MARNIITDDIRAAGFCVDGLREWAEAHDLNLRKIVKGQYTIDDVEHIEDANIQRVIEIARKRHEGNG